MAAKQLSTFDPLAHTRSVWAARKGNLRCTAIRLSNGELCLYSPVLGLNDDAIASLADLGPVSHLLAPNYYHNKGLTEYVEAYPQATLVSHPTAAARLKQQTGLVTEPLDSLVALLPRGIKILTPEGLKNGEVWLCIRKNKQVSWVVGDAFAGGKEIADDHCDQPGFLKTFPSFGVQDKAKYADWVRRQIQQDKPTQLIPCHGPACESKQLADALADLIGQHFP